MHNNRLKQIIFIVALIALGGFLFWLMKGFLSAMLGALVFYILLRQPFFYLTERAKKKWNKTLAIVLVLFISFLLLVLPVFLVSLMLSSKISYLIGHYQDLLQMVQQFSDRAKEYTGTDLLTPGSISKLTNTLADAAPKILTATANAVIDVFVVYLLLFFMFNDARNLERGVKMYLPFRPDNNQLLIQELKKQTIANAIGIPLLSIAIALVAWLGYWIFGVGQPLFWGVLTGLGGVVPVVGIGIVWVPVAVFTYLAGHTGLGVGLTLYCLVVFTLVENLFRLVVMKKLGDVHPLIAFFGVIIGIDLFGFVGVIFGPLLISYMVLLIRIYRIEYVESVDEHVET